MEMHLDLGEYQYGRMDQRPSPGLVTFAQILLQSSYDLQQTILQEITSNPALELVESDDCVRCGGRLFYGLCARCDGIGDDEWPHSADGASNSDLDPFSFVAGQMTLAEALMRELVMVLPADDHFIADYLCGSLDDNGLLGTSTAEIAATLGVSEERVVEVLLLLQSVGPLGAGARSVQECLEIQLRRWSELGEAPALARPLVLEYLDELAAGKYGFLAKRLGVQYDDIIAARDFIRHRLRPYPVSDIAEAEHSNSVTNVPFVVPDIVITRVEGESSEFDVTVIESRRAGLRINPMYEAMCTSKGRKGYSISGEEVEHVRAQVNRARDFTSHINERRRTMKRVAIHVVERQKEFLCHGWRELQPLTRAEVAEALSLHESTISRATADKYVMLPNGQVIPFAKFFRASLSVEDLIAELVASESEPLTDAQLAKLLGDAGFFVARRTVAKYRNRMGILPSSLR